MTVLCPVACLALLLTAGPSAAQVDDVAFLEGLRQRRLYRLIDVHCQSRLTESDFPEAAMVDVVVAWIRAGTQRALEAPPASREKHWQQLNDITELTEPVRRNPRGVLIELQLALAELARAELAAEETDDGKEQQTQFRRAINSLKAVDSTIAEKLQISYQQPASKQELKTTALEALRRNVSVELARAYRAQAFCYLVDSPDRANSLTLALEKLQIVTGLTNKESVIWRARLEEITCLRHLSRFETAHARITKWQQADPPAETSSRLTGELLRLDLAADEIERALSRAEAIQRDESYVPTAESDDAILEVVLAARNQARPSQQQQLTQLASRLTQQIAERHGPYWKRRAQARLGGALAGSDSTDDPELLIHAAASLYQAGKLAEAIATYDRATEKFEQAGDDRNSFTAAHTAAAISRETGDAANALQRFRQLALRHSGHRAAATAHLIACGLAANAVRETEGENLADPQQRYQKLLVEQLDLWPRGDEADTARWWLGRLLMSRGQWRSALEHLTQVSRESSSFSEAVLAAAECYQQELASLKDNNQRNELIMEATSFLQPIITGAENRWPDNWTRLMLDVSLQLGEMNLRYAPNGEEYAAKLLKKALQHASPADDQWKAATLALAAAAEARLGHRDRAIRLLSHENTSTPESVLLFLQTLHFQEEQNEILQSEIAKTVVAVTEVLSDSGPSGNEKTRGELARYRGFALEILGHDARALAAYHQWVQLCPESGEAQESYATLLGKSRDAQELRKSLELWQQIENRSKPAGPRWWRARRARIQLLEQLGNKDQAEKLRQLTTVLYPEAGDESP